MTDFFSKQFSLRGPVAALLLSAVLAGCGGGTGQSTVQNEDTSGNGGGNTGVVYAGPSPQTDDVQNFKLNVWDNLASESRCGACHSTGGQEPQFVRDDDINLAYSAAGTIVNLSSPSESRMVAKVAGGHNCWESEPSVCGAIITNYLEAWASASGSESNVIVLTAPPVKDVGDSKSFPADSSGFASTVYPILTTYCADCHSEDASNKQQPYFASSDIAVAYDAVKSKIDLDDPADSRLVVRLRSEFHNCWSDCASDSNTMESTIASFSAGIPLTQVDPSLVTSKALGLPDGIVASSGGRVETNVIALYEFKVGSGLTAFDTSGVDPSLNLTLQGDVEWVGSWGIRINDGKAQGLSGASSKLYDLITATGEYSIEAWVVPDNVTQEGPARIVSYSGGDTIRNFTLGQTLYNYDFLNRSSVTDENGMPALSTPDADEVLQATLQHVVATYDPINGRRIYVNGELVTPADGLGGGSLNDWDNSFVLVLGNEASNNQLWKGTLRLVAIHNRALSQEDIQANYDAGVGEKFFLLFNVTDLTGVNDSYIVFEVQQFDDYSYLFNKPFFISLDSSAAPTNISLQGMRIGINGQEATIGQAYANIDMTLGGSAYVPGTGQAISDLGTLIALDKGADSDEFFLTFDVLGSNTYARTPPATPTPAAPADLSEQALIGLRKFEEINATLSAVTEVPRTNSAVMATYATVRQQLPSIESIDGFLSAHQMGITQLAVEYCNELVDDTTLRASYFPGFDFNDTNMATAFDNSGRSQIITPLVEHLLAHDLPVGTGYPSPAPLTTQPLSGEIELELNSLIDTMAACGSGCSASRVTTTAKAVCAAAVGSAVMLVQ